MSENPEKRKKKKRYSLFSLKGARVLIERTFKEEGSGFYGLPSQVSEREGDEPC